MTFDAWDAGSQMWLDHGYAFLTINYRGSTTFGKAFEEAIYGHFGGDPVEQERVPLTLERLRKIAGGG